MSKPTPQWIPSDDCAITVGGETYHPHEGERVQMFVGVNIAETKAIAHIMRLSVDMDAAQGEADEAQRIYGILEGHYDEVCALLADRIVDWDWTDDKGRRLPKPEDDPTVMNRLRSEELYWLMKAAQGETTGERKNASRPLPTTSSATA